MSKILNVLRWLTAAGTVLVLLLLAWQCVDIYLMGNSSASFDENGVPLQSVYRMNDVTDRLKHFALPMVAYGVLMLLSLILHMICGQGRSDAQKVSLKTLSTLRQDKAACVQGRSSLVSVPMIRMALLAVAVIFILLGAMNGGWYDVFVKAISICTECIGLG